MVLSNSFVGLYSFRKELLQAYRERGCEVYISCPIGNDELKAEWFKGIGCEIISTPFERKGTNPFTDFKLMLRYRQIIKQIKPDFVLSYTIKSNIYGGMACALCHVCQLANIMELRDSSAIVSKDDAKALADKIKYIITHIGYTN